MKPKTLLVLLILVVGLGGFIWFFEKDVLSTEERAAQERSCRQSEDRRGHRDQHRA